ncbi:hypothetical protein TCAL_05506 [Tigriopus californicus]|uniref:Uncharacterized protein n=1 Tax=Tigriopus californicus TaxID=6832 RepID=A0A553NPZ1_TIGCA|nr:hypothetical protein TCAL_05506 [Tigriopus californicus]
MRWINVTNAFCILSTDSVHKPPTNLELASDESDFEPDDDDEPSSGSGGRTKLTRKVLDQLEGNLAQSPSVGHVQQLAMAFKAALGTLKTEGAMVSPFKIEGAAMFNAVIRTCLTHMAPALQAVLRVEGELKPSKLMRAKKWKPLNKTLKMYTADVTLFLTALSESTVLCALLKHIHLMIPYFAALPKSAKQLITQLIKLWSTGEDAVRILAFMCLLKLTRTSQSSLFEPVVKHMYMAFVQNAKFTSPNTWPMINFMRRSLSEIFGLDPKSAYTHAFVYIRQLGITLRNAMTVQKKESIQSVYNWQYVHSLHFWCHFLGSNHPNEALEPLIYPLVQVLKGAIKLVYVAKYYPLRFHLCSMLSRLGHDTGKFIPVLPYYLDVLNRYNFNKKTSKVSMKPVDFGNILRISKSQMLENGTQDATLDHVYMGIGENLHYQAHKIAFPELTYPALVQMRDFVKKCKVANHCKKIKQLMDKIEETTKVITQRRNNATFGLKDADAIKNWEQVLETQGTPLGKFFTSLRKTKDEQKLKMTTEQEKLDDYDFIPKLDRKKAKQGNKEEFKGLLGGDDSDDSDLDDEERFKLIEDRGKKRKASTKATKNEEDSEDEDGEEDESKEEEGEGPDQESEDDDVEDEVEDFDLNDLDSDDEKPAPSKRVKVEAKNEDDTDSEEESD